MFSLLKIGYLWEAVNIVSRVFKCTHPYTLDTRKSPILHYLVDNTTAVM